MIYLADGESARQIHRLTVERIDRKGHQLAYRDEVARQERLATAATKPGRRGRDGGFLRWFRLPRFA